MPQRPLPQRSWLASIRSEEHTSELQSPTTLFPYTTLFRSISGVGHETDFTICDFVADIRAATPTAAAELACIDSASLRNQLISLQNQLNKQITFTLNQYAQKLDFLARRLISPMQQLTLKINQINQLKHRMDIALQGYLQTQNQHLLMLKNSLAQLNPKNVLSRGYAMVHNEAGEIVKSTHQLNVGNAVNLTFEQGSAGATIVVIKSD